MNDFDLEQSLLHRVCFHHEKLSLSCYTVNVETQLVSAYFPSQQFTGSLSLSTHFDLSSNARALAVLPYVCVMDHSSSCPPDPATFVHRWCFSQEVSVRLDRDLRHRGSSMTCHLHDVFSDVLSDILLPTGENPVYSCNLPSSTLRLWPSPEPCWRVPDSHLIVRGCSASDLLLKNVCYVDVEHRWEKERNSSSTRHQTVDWTERLSSWEQTKSTWRRQERVGESTTTRYRYCVSRDRETPSSCAEQSERPHLVGLTLKVNRPTKTPRAHSIEDYLKDDLRVS